MTFALSCLAGTSYAGATCPEPWYAFFDITSTHVDVGQIYLDVDYFDAIGDFPYFHLDPELTVQLRNSSGACWMTTFADASRNDGKRFQAKSP